MNYQRLFDTGIAQDAIRAWRDKGRLALGIVCCHVPHEILHAAGILPIRLRATGCGDSSEAEVWMSSFSCSFAKSILQYFIDGTYELDGLIASDGCMQAVRIYDNWRVRCQDSGKKQALFQIGAPRMSSPSTRDYYEAELRILAAGLEQLSGTQITEEKLLHAISLYNEQRRLVKALLELQKAETPVVTGAETAAILLSATNMTVEEHIELLRLFLAEADSRTPVTGHRARLMLIGSALDEPKYIEAIENKGGLVVADTLCLGSMGFGEELVVQDGKVWASIAAYYLDRLVCPRMIDNRDRLHSLIQQRALDYKVDGVIYQKMQNCACWGGEDLYLEPLLKEINVPILYLEREQKLANLAQLEVRAEAFIEMIEKEG